MATEIGNWTDFLKSQLQYNASQNRNLLFGSPSPQPTQTASPSSQAFLNPVTGEDISSKIVGEGGGTQGPASQPSGWGGANTAMGTLSGIVGSIGGGIPGLAASLVGHGLKYGMGKVAPESRAFKPNLLGPYGLNLDDPEESVAMQAVLDALKEQDPSTYRDLEMGANMKAASPYSSIYQGVFGGPLASTMTAAQRKELAALLGITLSASPGYTMPSGVPVYGPRAPEKMPEYGWFPSLMDSLFGTPPEAPPSFDPYGEPEAPGPSQDTGGFGSADTSSDPDAGSGGGPGGDW